jgi:hypothetical protein
MKSLARPLRGLASRFSGKFQAVLNEAKTRSGFFRVNRYNKDIEDLIK